MSKAILDVRNLTVKFPLMSKSVIRRKIGETVAVNNVSFSVERGSTLGIVGESGSGKTTLVRTILGAIAASGGEAWYHDGPNSTELLGLGRKARQSLASHMQMIFQDPFASLNPRMKVGDIIAEPLTINEPATRKEHRQRVIDMLSRVGLEADTVNRFPHAFSGGQRQRIGIARALILSPSIVVCDEAVSALDVSVRAQILGLLQDLQREMNYTYLFVTHDLNVMRHFCDEALVLYKGEAVESANVSELFTKPQHDYTRLLLSAIPSLDPDDRLKPLSRESLGLN